MWGKDGEDLFFWFQRSPCKETGISLWQSLQVSHFHFDPAFSVNITDVSLEVTYDICLHAGWQLKYLMSFLESTFINMVAQGN